MNKPINKPKILYSKDSKRLIDWLKAERARSGLTIRQLAQKLKWGHSIVGKIEQGERRLDVIEFVQYCAVLGADPQKGIKLLQNKTEIKE